MRKERCADDTVFFDENREEHWWCTIQFLTLVGCSFSTPANFNSPSGQLTRAEVAVKAAKRLLMSNIIPNGDLNNDSFLRALLQLRNTPDPDCNLSPAEVVFGHSLRDAFSFVNRLATFFNRFIRRTWREAWRAKEDALRVRAKQTNVAMSARTRPLRALRCGDRVFIQNQGGKHPRKWDKVGTVVEALDFHQYNVKVGGFGRITTRNRRFLCLMPDVAESLQTSLPPTVPS